MPVPSGTVTIAPLRTSTRYSFISVFHCDVHEPFTPKLCHYTVGGGMDAVLLTD